MMKKNYWLLGIVLLSVLIRLIFAFSYHELWWDSGVYLGMGKYAFSGGESGLWEHIRPPFVPLMLGVIWKIGLDPVFLGRIAEILMMGGVVALTFLLAKEWFNERVAILSSIILALSPIFFYLSFHQYAEIPSVLFFLLALYFGSKRPFLAGVCCAFAFLSKFPTGIVLAVLGAVFLLNANWAALMYLLAGFSLAVSPYFIATIFAYGSPLATLSAAQDAIARALGCNVLRYRPWWYYGYWLFFSESKLHLFSILGVGVLFKNWKRRQVVFAFALVLPLLYFLPMQCRDYRYLTLFLPFIVMLTSLGIVWLVERLNKRWFVPVVAVISICLAALCFNFYLGERALPNAIEQEFFELPQKSEVQGEIWTGNPIVAAFTNKRLEKVYYPIYDAKLAKDFNSYVELHSDRIGMVLLENCGGGLICPPDDADCEEETTRLIERLDERFTRIFDKSRGKCWYRAWVSVE